jgi:drug/metabolite transporter (DMT)-like permease
MELQDFFALLHPAIAIILVFPLIGIVVNRALLTRQRRLQVADGQKSKIPPLVGSEHVAIGNWLSRSVVGVALLGMAYPIFSKMLSNDTLTKEPFRVFFAIAIFLLTIASFTLLFKARVKLWRGIFATFTGMGLIILGFQPEVFRRDNEWFISHYYYGITAALLMIFSVAIVQDIYQDKQNRWRTVHIILNCLALLLFIGQGMTGTRDLLEIPLHWQEQYIYQCDFTNKTCPQPK